MTDCPNAEMRDRLPDLLHERLDASARAAVIAHVSECSDCDAELALLRQVRVSLSSGVVDIDTAAVARRVVTRAAAPRTAAMRGRFWSDWRLAAAVAVIAVGGASLATVYARRGGVTDDTTLSSPSVIGRAARSDTVAAAPLVSPVTPGSEHSIAGVSRARGELAAAGDVGDLSESELRTLLGDLDTIEAVPATEPEPVTVRVSLPEQGGTD